MGEYKESWKKKESIFCVFKNNLKKDNVKLAHWGGHSKLRSLHIDDFFKRTPEFYENQASVTGNI